jgi:hypothetical protein
MDKAVEYGARAGARADALLAYEEAARHYEIAIQALQRHQPPDKARHCQLLLAFGDAKESRQNKLSVYVFGRIVSFHSPWNLSRLMARLSSC